MGEPFKHQLNAGSVDAMARHLRRVSAVFDADAFVVVALPGLEALAFKARAMQMADALEAALPVPFDVAATAIEAALGPPGVGDDLSGLTTTDAGLGGWSVWPLGEYVARRGLAHPERALPALQALTQRFSAEFAIRPFIAAHPDLVFPTLAQWLNHPSAHVRRLVSEGSRPRLPWGMQLKALVADPSPTLPLLAALQDDPSAYVRRSVANHLNDIAKDHPGRMADWLLTHLPDASADRRALLRHASRSLIKRGHAPTLAAWGLDSPLHGRALLTVSPDHMALGDDVELSLTLVSTALRAQVLEIDYVIHHVKANGSGSPKVFKGWRLRLAPGERCTLVRRHAVRTISTRTYHPGWHRVVVQVNGEAVAESGFDLVIGAVR